MYKELKKIMDNQELVAIYANPLDYGKFLVGYVLAIDEMWFVMENISSSGKYEGISSHLIDNIIKIEFAGEYINNINKLITFHREKRNIFKNFKNHPLFDLFEYAKTNDKMCEIVLIDSDLTDAAGFIESYDEGILKIKLITEAGKNDGIAIVAIERMSKIWCDSESGRVAEWLYKLNN